MGKNTNNPLLKGITGRIGDWQFKQVRGKTVIAKRPRKVSKRKAASPQQQETRDRFREATAYAHAALADDTKRTYYQQQAKKLNLPNAYTAAITDFMRKTRVINIDTQRYTGKAGGEISVHAVKRAFGIKEVKVTLSSKGGDVIEQGLATHQRGYLWTYQTRVPALKEGVIITIDTRDAPGNTTRIVQGDTTISTFQWRKNPALQHAA